MARMGTCEVCHQYTWVDYCSVCKAYICGSCKYKVLARARAAIKRHF